MRQNILLYHDQDKETTLALKVSCANYSFVSYHLASDNTLVISENSVVPDSHRVSLVHQLKRLLKDLEVQSKVFFIVSKLALCFFQRRLPYSYTMGSFISQGFYSEQG